MSALARQLGKDLLALPKKVRAELAHKLILSLEDEEQNKDELWRQEIGKRSRDIAEGRVKCKPIESVVADIRRKLEDAHSKSSRR